ncbi:MAG TPA: DNA-3-methyladenine glycosylase [Mycobacteriales bacterium]|nr:DNA-3-methyladenine glycosylase [Mycobacteriales bacterium]
MGSRGRLRRGRALSRVLPRSFYARPVLDVARDLLGCSLVSDVGGSRVVVRITEVEAYAGADDPASHAHRRRTDRNAVMFGPPGHAYVYFTYGMHWCLNLVASRDGDPAAVLVRAGEVVLGIDTARTRRAGSRDRDLARGPARLASALGVDGGCNGLDVTRRGPVLHVLTAEPVDDALVATGPRVGIRAAAEVPWRLWLAGDPTVSDFRPGALRSRRPADPL